jgi:GT2 family glycosyltransferase
MKLRIVTATRGSSLFFDEATASIKSAHPEAEQVIVCPAACVPSIAAGTGVVVLPETSTGLYAALNQGWRAPGEWDVMTSLNDDDLLLSPGFGRLLDELVRRPEVDVAYGRVRLIGARGENIGAQPVARHVGDLEALLARGIVPLAQPGMVMRRRLVERLGGFDEAYRLAGDLDFFVRAVVAGARFLFVNTWTAGFRLHAGQLSRQRVEIEAEKMRSLQPLASKAGGTAALWRFRLDNAGVYYERIRHYGWISMAGLYDRTE